MSDRDHYTGGTFLLVTLLALVEGFRLKLYHSCAGLCAKSESGPDSPNPTLPPYTPQNYNYRAWQVSPSVSYAI